MKLSVIIVNYNVKYFLENCLHSVREACKDLDAEVIVIDNNSKDGSATMIKEVFPEVVWVANQENLGFSKANNQGMKMAKGKYCVLLNPDTVVSEDTFHKVVDYLDKEEKVGGLGVRMIDGGGTFLKESKRGLPTPLVAFYKISGMSRLFPKSKKFSAYHLGHLDEFSVADIEILSGACMFLRMSVIDKIGGLDEDFFMYGEDIDLSWRIIQAGYRNVYFPETTIIHYKGESTKKSSVNYVFVFYRAMVIFAKKHFSGKNARIFSFIINLAIYLRAFAAIISRFVKRFYLPLLDALLIFFILLMSKEWYEDYYLSMEDYFPEEVSTYAFPAIVIVWLTSIYFYGGYNRPNRMLNLFQGLLTGSILLLISYALLNETLRFSRAVILAQILVTWMLLPLLRFALNLAGWFPLDDNKKKKMAVVGDQTEFDRIQRILSESYIPVEKAISVKPDNDFDEIQKHDAFLYQLSDICQVYHINEIVFCNKNLSPGSIISLIQSPFRDIVSFKIAQPSSDYIIGSSSNENSGEYYLSETYSVMLPQNQRKKKTFDFLVAIIFLITTPITLFFYKKRMNFISNLFAVLFGKKSFIGFDMKEQDGNSSISIPGIITPSKENMNISILNVEPWKYYAHNYSISLDVEILTRRIQDLDKS